MPSPGWSRNSAGSSSPRKPSKPPTLSVVDGTFIGPLSRDAIYDERISSS